MKAAVKTPQKFLTVYEAAPILDLHFRTVTRRCIDGSIPAVKLGSKWRIPMSSLDNLVAKK